MKKIYLLLLLISGFFYAQSQSLFTYGPYSVSKDEFMRAYNKNKTPVTDREKALRDYLELYSHFKLKVKAAEDARIDTLQQLSTDLDNFRRQVAETYLNDDKGMKSLMEEAFLRSQKDIRVSMLSFPADKKAAPADTLALFESVQEQYRDILAGTANPQWKDLGYITAFSLPYTYENIVYSLPSDGVSKPYRSRNGWLIFKKTGERKSAGKWKVAQILFSYPPDPDETTKARIRKLADSVWNLLRNGANFGDMARQFSNDKLTYLTGGELPEFGTGKYDEDFESRVFGLAANGDISQPFSTSFGIHIIKRLQHTETPSDPNDNSFQYELNQKILLDPRVSIAKDKFAQDIRAKIGFKKLTAVKDADLFRFADSVAVHPEDGYISGLPLARKPVIGFTKENVTMADWLNFVVSYKGNASQYKGETNEQLWDKYTAAASLDYYRKHLEEYNADFRFQIQEFKEGNMLFEIMEKNVWSKASSDSVGLKSYYEANKSQYKWGASADLLIVNCISDEAALKAIDLLKKGGNWRDIAETRPDEIQIDSGRYEIAQVLGDDKAVFPGVNAFTPVSKNSDGTASFFLFLHEYAPNAGKSFEEARGLVINDYQQVVEMKWLEALKKKYPIKVNEAVFRTLLK